MKKGARRRYRKFKRKAGEPNCIICSPRLRGYRIKYKPRERLQERGEVMGFVSNGVRV